MGIHTTCLDPQEHPPAEGVADICIRGDLQSPEAIRELAGRVDVLTFEIEHIHTPVLHEIRSRGIPVFPQPDTLETIQDKLVQKQCFLQAGLPVPRFSAWDSPGEGLPRGFGYPAVQKLRRGGYDGRGVQVLTGPRGEILEGPSMVEECISFEMELAVLLARGRDGEIRTWPVIEMVFDPHTQICNSVCAPARISQEVAERALDVGTRAVEALEGVGVFAVELFLTPQGEVLINEVAPRPHNSGHWTIEGSLTSQFDQHIRAVCGLPLGSTDLTKPSVMVNLLGAAGASGSPVIRGYDQALALPGLNFHWYEKDRVSSQRKMGHVTILADRLDEALELSRRAEQILRVEGI